MVSTTELGRLTTAAITAAERANAATITEAAALVLGCLRADALVLTAGAGHSLAAVAETFYRAGGLAPVYPVYHPDLLPMHGAGASTLAERRQGLAAEVLSGIGPGPGDVLVVFSTSGVNPYPLELASHAREAGLAVVAVTSPASSAAAPRRGGGILAEQADVVLDTGIRPGDASYPEQAPRTAALSTIVNAHLWNLVLASVLELAAAEGLEVPLWRSSNTVGGDEANAALLERYRPRVPPLR
ncbi:SIS domain-containing protein [Amycolatopsis antarctica]|uniref:SIS domain-containing protein n=1 Tax=Amycolatopsis antarctica TaxID=1854586 RepID=UPI003B82F3F6